MYSKKLNLDIFPLINNTLPTDRYQTRVEINQLNEKVIDLFRDLGLSIGHITIFYSPKFTIGKCHIDGTYPDAQWDSRAKLNYIISGPDGLMNWYRVLENIVVDTERKTTPVNTYFVEFGLSDCTLVESSNLSGWNIVDAGIPHNVTTGDEDRWAISIFFRKDGKWLTLDEASGVFSKYIIA